MFERRLGEPERTAVPLTGLAAGAKMRPAVLGRRGSRLVVDATHARTAVDDGSGLTLFPLADVFTRPTVFLGFGKPNTYLAFPDPDGGWQKFAAFMFFRSKSFIANTKGRTQAGVLFELPGLPAAAVDRLRAAATARAGHRTVSCAWANAQILADAGFTCGGRSLRRLARPSHLAARIWEHGLELDGTPVPVRVIQTGGAPADHFREVWGLEFKSPGRLVRKMLARDRHGSAPVFDVVETADLGDAAGPGPAGVRTSVSISRPSLLGVHLGYLFGEQPIFAVDLPAPVTVTGLPPLAAPLTPFPGKLAPMTRLKKYLLFSRPVVSWMNRHLAQEFETYDDVPAGELVRALRPSCRNRGDAFVYNFVVTSTQIRIKRLENRNGRDAHLLNWMLAKHVLLAGYSTDLRLAGELWTYLAPDGRQVLVINDSSGTYQPGPERIGPLAGLLAAVLGVTIEVDAAHRDTLPGTT